MVRIQSVALDLFEKRGFSAVTIEDIARAADVSPSSVYRYFGTKEGIVFTDEYDRATDEYMLDLLTTHPPLAAARLAMIAASEQFTRSDGEVFRRRAALAVSEPSILSAALTSAFARAQTFAQRWSRQSGRSINETAPIAYAIVFALEGTIAMSLREDQAMPVEQALQVALESLRTLAD